MTFALLGAGRLGEALLAGLSSAGALPAGVVATVRRQARGVGLSARFRLEVTTDNAAAVRGQKLVVLGVRHRDVPPLLRLVGPSLHPDAAVVSLAIGAPLSLLQELLPPPIGVVRAVANTALSVRTGAVALCAGRASADQRARVETLFAPVARVCDCPEDQLDAWNALAGAGPAFVAEALRTLQQAAAAEGLGQERARSGALQTAAGVLRLLEERGLSAEELVREIAGPGGSTAAGLAQLASLGGLFAAAVQAAVARARERARELQPRPAAPAAEIRSLPPSVIRARADELAEILHDCVEGGASVGFLAGFTPAEARAFWLKCADAVEGGRRVLFAAGAPHLDGTAQLVLHTPINQPHRAELAKMLVHRRARAQGLGRALFAAVEREARARGRTLLTFDTVSGSAAERLYLACGCVKSGEVPGYALFPDGRPCATSVFFKRL